MVIGAGVRCSWVSRLPPCGPGNVAGVRVNVEVQPQQNHRASALMRVGQGLPQPMEQPDCGRCRAYMDGRDGGGRCRSSPAAAAVVGRWIGARVWPPIHRPQFAASHPRFLPCYPGLWLYTVVSERVNQSRKRRLNASVWFNMTQCPQGKPCTAQSARPACSASHLAEWNMKGLRSP